VHFVTLVHPVFSSCDLVLGAMTLIYELNLDIPKTQAYLCVSKMTLLGQSFQKLEHEENRQTDRHTQREMRPNALPQPY